MPFVKDMLPEPEVYYSDQVDNLRVRGKYATGLCPFHGESHPSFSINTETGSYKCFSCGASGGDILAFHRARFELGFVEAAKELGAWK